ncbi:hypothetical protein BJX63DRAFT_146519 [Aspergillus granulosus]|uniref:Uncharacterized protein n=1 Tax=Aspergillus granulosus TaxID=176169 RepID=A0ABR4GRZ0_9EURO
MHPTSPRSTMAHGKDAVLKIVQELLEQNPKIKSTPSPPNRDLKFLSHSSYRHANMDDDFQRCDKAELIKHLARHSTTLYMHYGLIAPGDQVMKDAEKRDSLSQQLGVHCRSRFYGRTFDSYNQKKYAIIVTPIRRNSGKDMQH